MASKVDEKAGAEIVRGKEACDRFSKELMKELGFLSDVLHTGELEECGKRESHWFYVVEMQGHFEHFNVATNTKASYTVETTTYMEKGRMKKMTGVKTKQLMVWVPIVEMCMNGNKITFKTPMGVGKSFPITSFMNEEEKKKYLQQKGAAN